MCICNLVINDYWIPYQTLHHSNHKAMMEFTKHSLILTDTGVLKKYTLQETNMTNGKPTTNELMYFLLKIRGWIPAIVINSWSFPGNAGVHQLQWGKPQKWQPQLVVVVGLRWDFNTSHKNSGIKTLNPKPNSHETRPKILEFFFGLKKFGSDSKRAALRSVWEG